MTLILTIVFYIWLAAILAIGLLMWRGLVKSVRDTSNLLTLITVNISKNSDAINQLTAFKARLIEVLEHLDTTASRIADLEKDLHAHDH